MIQTVVLVFMLCCSSFYVGFYLGKGTGAPKQFKHGKH